MFRKFVALLFASITITAAAQPPEELPAPVKEHEWLQQFAGEWTSESKASMGPGQPEMECKGTMGAKKLGGFWLIADLKGEWQGTQLHAIMTLGYDTEKKAYVGTWVDSMMNHMWKYEGHLDESGKKLVLGAEGPDFVQPGKTTKFRDAWEFKSADHIELTSSMLGPDGKWTTFMTGQFTRKK